jgi:CHASE2 domain-containing sensor protein
LGFKKKKVAINKYGEVLVKYPQKDSLKYISFYDIFRGNTDKSQIANKIVLIGYDGNLIDSLTTPIGKVKVHRIFYYSLVDIYNQLQ